MRTTSNEASVVMSATTTMPSRAKVGMASLIFMESAFFAAFLVTYLYYIGKSPDGPQPLDCLELGPVLFNSACLIASSVTVVLAVKSLARGALVTRFAQPVEVRQVHEQQFAFIPDREIHGDARRAFVIAVVVGRKGRADVALLGIEGEAHFGPIEELGDIAEGEL